MLADTNDLRCQRVPMYGSDLVSAVTLGDRLPNLKYTTGYSLKYINIFTTFEKIFYW